MHIIIDRILRGFLGCLEQRANINVKTDICKGGGDHLGTPVVAVLPHLDDQHPRACGPSSSAKASTDRPEWPQNRASPS
jgi:hypothetical protein